MNAVGFDTFHFVFKMLVGVRWRTQYCVCISNTSMPKAIVHRHTGEDLASKAHVGLNLRPSGEQYVPTRQNQQPKIMRLRTRSFKVSRRRSVRCKFLNEVSMSSKKRTPKTIAKEINETTEENKQKTRNRGRKEKICCPWSTVRLL